MKHYLTNLMFPTEITLIISGFIPLKFRTVSKLFIINNDDFIKNYYSDTFKKLDNARSYLNSLRVKPDHNSLKQYFNSVYSKNNCNHPTKKGTPCKNKVRGYNKCYLHREKQLTNIEIIPNSSTYYVDHLSLPNTKRLRIDPYDGQLYNYKEFVEYYGNNDVWKESELYNHTYFIRIN